MSGPDRAEARMPQAHGIATTRRRLRTELRRLRESARLHQTDVARRLDWSVSKLIRIENGSVGVSVTDLRALMGIYQADAQAVEELTTLARATRTRQWWSTYRQFLSPSFRDLLGYEADAACIAQLHPSLVPGLLQTEAYMRAVIPATTLARKPPEHLDAMIAVRRIRQQKILGGDDPTDYTAVIDEAALHRLVGAEQVMREQLEHLAFLAEADGNVRVAVLPFRAGAHPGLQGAYIVMDFDSPDEQSVLFLETAIGTPVEREPEEVERYRTAFREMLERSLQGQAAAAFIRKTAS